MVIFFTDGFSTSFPSIFTLPLLSFSKPASVFRRVGYNCVIYDDRRHGENEKTVTTFGLKESKDLLAVIRDTRERFGKDIMMIIII